MYPNSTHQELSEYFGRTQNQVYSKAANLGLKKTPEHRERMQEFTNKALTNAGIANRFVKGQVSFNKGKKQSDYMSEDAINRSKATRFKAGHRPANWVPVGSTRIDAKDGYKLVKVAEPRVWDLAHRVLWEEHNGKLKDGEILTFINGDKTDIRLDNLQKITLADNAKRNSIYNYPPEIVRIIRLQRRLERLVNDGKKMDK